MAETAGRGLARKLGLERLETDVAPVTVPAVTLLVGRTERAGQVLQHAQVVQRMDVARHRKRERAHASATARVARQQRRRRIRLVEPLDDRERLRQHLPVVGDERRHEALRIQREIVVRALRAFAQMHEVALRRDAVEVELDPHAERGRQAEVVVELHVKSRVRLDFLFPA